jgi:hypothetical protein
MDCIKRARSSEGLKREPYAASRRYTHNFDADERSRNVRAASAESLSTIDQRKGNARAVSRQYLQTWVTAIHSCGFSRTERSGRNESGNWSSKISRLNIYASTSPGRVFIGAKTLRMTPTERIAACSLTSSRSSYSRSEQKVKQM